MLQDPRVPEDCRIMTFQNNEDKMHGDFYVDGIEYNITKNQLILSSEDQDPDEDYVS